VSWALVFVQRPFAGFKPLDDDVLAVFVLEFEIIILPDVLGIHGHFQGGVVLDPQGLQILAPLVSLFSC